MSIPSFNEIIEQNDQTEARQASLDAMRELVGNVYPNKYTRSDISGVEDTITNILHFPPIVGIGFTGTETQRSQAIEATGHPARREHHVLQQLRRRHPVHVPDAPQCCQNVELPQGQFVNGKCGIHTALEVLRQHDHTPDDGEW